MSLIKTLHLRTSLLLGSVFGLGFGCVIELGPPAEPCATGEHNQLDDEGDCTCDIGYDWCDPSDDSNLNCCDNDIGDDEIDGDGDGPDDGPDDDVDTDDDVGTDSDSTGDGDGDGDGDTGTLPPENCEAEEEGFYWCTHSEAMGPQNSQLFVCTGGSWVEEAALMDESCMFDGYDFAYGCVDDGMSVIFECGVGSGDDCAEDAPITCIDDDQIAYCLDGKETWDSCLAFCQEMGIDGITYEYGECDDTDPADVACFCCDSGDEGCPI
jgi:hypothetical protein